MPPFPLILIAAFVFGTLVGSFLNVCIHRLPRQLSIVRPGSRCPACSTPIPAYHNVPLVSYLVLRGRCAACRATISPRYPVVELLAGLLSLAVLLQFGPTVSYPVFFAFGAALVVVTFIDLDHQIIPDRITLPGVAVGLAASFLPWFLPTPWLGSYPVTPGGSLGGLLLGGVGLFSIAYGYFLLTGREGMGMGDVKYLAMIGAFLGWKGVLSTLFLASLFGTVIGTPLVLLRGGGRHTALPFGPFLSLGALAALFHQDALIAAYAWLGRLGMPADLPPLGP